MKKFLIAILCLSIIACTFVACSKSSGDDTSTTESTTVTVTDDEKCVDARALMSQYSAKELGISAKDFNRCKIYTKPEPVQIDGYDGDFIEVHFQVLVENSEPDANGNTTYNFEDYGVFFVSKDMKTVLKQNDVNDSKKGYTKLKTKKLEETTVSDVHESTKSEQESETKKK